MRWSIGGIRDDSGNTMRWIGWDGWEIILWTMARSCLWSQSIGQEGCVQPHSSINQVYMRWSIGDSGGIRDDSGNTMRWIGWDGWEIILWTMARSCLWSQSIGQEGCVQPHSSINQVYMRWSIGDSGGIRDDSGNTMRWMGWDGWEIILWTTAGSCIWSQSIGQKGCVQSHSSAMFHVPFYE